MTVARTLITGMHGTVAPVLAEELRRRGGETIAWDRNEVPPHDEHAVVDFIHASCATALVHCGMGDPRWAEHMAACCARRGIAFLYTGSVSVYGHHQTGPHGVSAVPEPQDDYGRYKLACERHVRAVNPAAHIVRLGWQIALRPGGNQMVDYLMRQQAEHGRIDASTCWLQACSFLDDTARVLADVLERFPPGLYQLDGNPGWNFHRLACALNRAMGNPWIVHACEGLRLNNMVRDARLPSVSIEARLSGA
ncbi:MAG: sugar nucleotide-binding protein [Planctomycetes bacterium]|nr:sugar nucleotide-binding protein [Planctomycetota bacterium]